MMCRAKEAEGVGRKSRATIISLIAGTVAVDEGDTNLESVSESNDDGERVVWA